MSDELMDMGMGDWLRLTDSERDRIMKAYIGEGRQVKHGRLKQEAMGIPKSPTRRQLAEARGDEVSYPVGPPSDRWSSEALQAFTEDHDRLVEQDAAGTITPLDLNRLDDEQLKAIANCTSQEQVALVEQAIRNGKPMPKLAAQADDRQSIVELRWSKT